MTSPNELGCPRSSTAFWAAWCSAPARLRDRRPSARTKDAVDFGRPAVTRRLSPEQYQAIIADVFGSTIELGGRFEPDMRQDGLLAVGDGQLSVTSAGMEQYDAMARTISAQVVDEKHRQLLIPCKPASADREMAGRRLRQTVLQPRSARLLYRRALTPDEMTAAGRCAAADTARQVAQRLLHRPGAEPGDHAGIAQLPVPQREARSRSRNIPRRLAPGSLFQGIAAQLLLVELRAPELRAARGRLRSGKLNTPEGHRPAGRPHDRAARASKAACGRSSSTCWASTRSRR